jgi:hypothetical protein
MGVVTDDEARRPPRLSPCGRGRVAAVRRRRVRGGGPGPRPASLWRGPSRPPGLAAGSIIFPKVMKREWDVVSHLSLQIKTYRNLRRRDDALRQMLEVIDGVEDTNSKAAVASFAARALEYLAGAETNIRLLVDRIYRLAIDQAVLGEFEALKDIPQAARCAVERRDFVDSTIVDLISQCFKADDFPRIRISAALISGVLRHATLHHSTLGTVEKIPERLISHVKLKPKNLIADKANRHPLYASLAWEWYRHINEPLVRKHGLSIYYYSRPLGDHFSLDGFILMLLMMGTGVRDYTNITAPQATHAVAVIGQAILASWPLKRSDFGTDSNSDAPLSFFTSVLRSVAEQPAVAGGVVLIMMLIMELGSGERRIPGQAIELASTTLRNWEPTHSKLRTRIEAILEAGTMFQAQGDAMQE